MADRYGIKILYSTPYYARANGQAEASNKVIKNILRKMVQGNLQEWHIKVSEALWAYRVSPRTSTGVSPFALTYGHDVVLPLEIAVSSLRTTLPGHEMPFIGVRRVFQNPLQKLSHSRLRPRFLTQRNTEVSCIKIGIDATVGTILPIRLLGGGRGLPDLGLDGSDRPRHPPIVSVMLMT
ncbi:uncharacterized protein LOC131238913 [Magnolia sinica]|uniref:uncharacterized protein LOC131238913 n=1 Tax=Magnolia sinica TaxID=86752 RepID=UPI00265B041E|nr:uncharacterized protein LOC131238913 [Magnolia sinica]